MSGIHEVTTMQWKLRVVSLSASILAELCARERKRARGERM